MTDNNLADNGLTDNNMADNDFTDNNQMADEFYLEVDSLDDNATAQFQAVGNIFKTITTGYAPVDSAIEILRTTAKYLASYEISQDFPTIEKQRVMNIYRVCKSVLLEICKPDLSLESEPDISFMNVCRIKMDKVEDLLVIIRGLEVIYLRDYGLCPATAHDSLVIHNELLHSQAATTEVHRLRNWWREIDPAYNGDDNCFTALKGCETLLTHQN